MCLGAKLSVDLWMGSNPKECNLKDAPSPLIVVMLKTGAVFKQHQNEIDSALSWRVFRFFLFTSNLSSCKFIAFHDNFCWSTKGAENLVSMFWYCVDTKSFTMLVHPRKAQSSKSDELPLMSFIWDLSNLLWNAMKSSSDSWVNLGSHGKAQQQQKLRQTESIHTGNTGNTRYTYK